MRKPEIISNISFAETRNISEVLSSYETNIFTSRIFDSFQRKWKKLCHPKLLNAPLRVLCFPSCPFSPVRRQVSLTLKGTPAST